MMKSYPQPVKKKKYLVTYSRLEASQKALLRYRLATQSLLDFRFLFLAPFLSFPVFSVEIKLFHQTPSTALGKQNN